MENSLYVSRRELFAFAIHALAKHAFENYCETVHRLAPWGNSKPLDWIYRMLSRFAFIVYK